MSQTTVAVEFVPDEQISAAPPARARLRSRHLTSIYAELAKARLSALVVITTAVGYALGSEFDTPAEWSRFFFTLLGTAMSAAGANTINQWMEISRDARMQRTRFRPLPDGRISRAHALAFGLLMSLGGPLLLALRVNPLAALLGLATVAIYVLIYTPLKPRTPLNTVAGAVCGAIPPMMGWAAATESLAQPAWVLGGLLFLWQIPHSLALAWLYRDDYARGGFRMLPIIDSSGRVTCQAAVLYSLALLPVGLMLTMQGVCGWIYAIGSLVAGLVFVAASVQLYLRRDRTSARRVFFASIIYLPVLMALMIVDQKQVIHLPGRMQLIAVSDPVRPELMPHLLNPDSATPTGTTTRSATPTPPGADATDR